MQEATAQEKEELEKIKENALIVKNVCWAKQELTLFFLQEFRTTNLC